MTKPSGCGAVRSIAIAVAASLNFAAIASAQTPARIVVESPAMTTGQMMPRDYSPDGRNVSPPLTWGSLPPGTRQLAVICQDHGAGNPPPWVHWIIYNIPASAQGLPEGIPIDRSDPMPAGLEGVTQGNNNWGLAMYRGPAPPAGTVHEYDFTVFALDAELDLPPGLNRAALLAAIEGHVLGQGNMVPTYTRQPAEAGTLQ
jgi:Raf kinase inhibitor-like YbhB/YbcL family protein